MSSWYLRHAALGIVLLGKQNLDPPIWRITDLLSAQPTA
jgi:hypothetical protein